MSRREVQGIALGVGPAVPRSCVWLRGEPDIPVQSQAGDLEKARRRGERDQALGGLWKCQMCVGRGQKWEVRKDLSWSWREMQKLGRWQGEQWES